MKKARIAIMLMAVMLAMLFLPQVSVHADEEDDKDVANSAFQVTVEAGLDGVGINGKALPLNIKIKNTGEDFQGTLRVIIPESGNQHAIAHEKTLSLPLGGEKTTYLLLSNIDDATFVRVELENEKGKILFSQRVSLSLVDASQNIIVGVLSSDFAALNYLDGITLSTNMGTVATKTIKLTADNIPENADGLVICNIIIIDNYNSSQLSEKQRGAIEDWTAKGGVLIFGTGSKATTTLEGFQGEMFDLQIGGVSKQVMQVYGANTTETKEVNAVDIDAGFWEDLYGFSSVPAYRSSYGNGAICVLSYSLSMEPLVSWWEGNSSLASGILSGAGYDANYEAMSTGKNVGSTGDYELNNALNAVDGNKAPNAFLYGAIYLLYVLLLGPIMYTILRNLDKREWMWVVMPATTVVFTLIIFATSTFYKIRKPFVDEISLVEFNQGSITTHSYLSLQSPKSGEYKISFGEGYNSVAAWEEDYNNTTVGGTNYRHAIYHDGDTLQLHVKRNSAFSEQKMLATKSEQAQAQGFDIQMEVGLSTMDGTVTNNTGYDLSDVVVCYGSGMYACLGKMANGETKNVSTDMIGTSYVGYNAGAWMEEAPRDDIFINQEKNQNLEITSSIYQYMAEIYNVAPEGRGMVFGRINDYDSQLVQEHSVTKYSAAVAVSYFYQIPKEYAAFSYFFDDINDYAVGSDKVPYSDKYDEVFDILYDTNLYGEESMEILYDLSSLKTNGALLVSGDAFQANITDSDVDDGDLSKQNDEVMETQYACVEIYNWSTQQYDKVFTSGYEEQVSIEPYVNEKQWMKIRYSISQEDKDNGVYDVLFPKISIVGGER